MKKSFFIFLSFFVSSFVFAQAGEVRLVYSGSPTYILTERSDLRRYDNGRYTGLTSHEVKSYIAPSKNYAGDDAWYFEGSFFVDQDTKRNSYNVKDGIHSDIPSSFKITQDGELKMICDNGYPMFRSFPSFTQKKIKFGDKWAATAERSVDPLNKGIFTKIPMTVEYCYLEDKVFNGIPVYVISAQWATRYGISYWDFGGDKDLKSAQGSHKARILVSKITGAAIVVNDTVDETFIYKDGTNVAFKGTINLFTEYPPSYNKNDLYRTLHKEFGIDEDEIKDALEGPLIASNPSSKPQQNSAGNLGKSSENSKNTKGNSKKPDGRPNGNSTNLTGNSQKTEKPSQTGGPAQKNPQKLQPQKELSGQNIKIGKTEAGIRLTMEKLNFYPDSAQLLPGEAERLDQIARILKQAPERMLLVEGHTASTGNPAGEQKLSLERANSIAKELSKRGIPEKFFICRGSGGTKPIADNSTPEGKAKNRRVEITILE